MKRENMTAETLKPFISSPSSDNFSPEDPTVKRQTTAKLIRIGLNVTYVAFAVAVLVFMVWSSVRVSQLESEVKSVTRLVESMQKRLGLDYLDDLVDIEKEYTNDLIDDSNSDDDDEEEEDEESDTLLGGVLTHNSDPVDYDDDDDDNDEDDDEEDDALLGGANGNYEDDDDDDDDDGIRTRNNQEAANNEKQDREDDISTAYPDDSEGDSYENDDNLYDDFEKYKDAKKLRKVRSIVESAPNDLPVYEESYALRRNKSGGPEDELIERHLLMNRNKTPTLRPQQRGGNVEAVAGVKLKETNKRHLGSNGGNRRTRHRLHQSSNGSRGGSSHLTQMRLHNRKIRAMMKSATKLGKPQALVATARVAAAHYHLNSTISGKHILHPSHSTLAHDGDLYIGAPHIWTKHLGMEKFFRINYGVLIVEQSGLYLVYAQIYYDNRYDRNGFVVYHNTHAFLQCAAYIPTNINKSHTCHTSGLIYLEQNDELHLRDIHRDRVVSLTNAKSFFGLVKIDGTA